MKQTKLFNRGVNSCLVDSNTKSKKSKNCENEQNQHFAVRELPLYHAAKKIGARHRLLRRSLVRFAPSAFLRGVVHMAQSRFETFSV